MNTRRIPFQFSTTDPLARQRELEKRFGLQSTYPNMYVDVNKPLSTGTTRKEISSPRLQHRVPIFVEGYDQPIHSSSVDSMASVPENKKANVRVIPIEVEGLDSKSPRHRTYSGPANTLKDRCDNLATERNERFPFKRCNYEDSSIPKLPSQPRVYNIPIQIEGANCSPRNSQTKVVSKAPSLTPKTDEAPKLKSAAAPANNGCPQSKLPSEVKHLRKDDYQSKSNECKIDRTQNIVESSLKKIENVLTEFKTYETGVTEFIGTSKDKQYRYLDEMLTRCMLRLDDIDTMGNEEIRLARKNAIKKVQASIDLLESKTSVQSVTSIEVPQVQTTPDENVVVENDDDVEMKDYQVMQDNVLTSTKSEKSSEKSEVDLSKTETGCKEELAKVTLENNNGTDIEMKELPQEKADSEMQAGLTPFQQQPMIEAEMIKKISLDEENSTNDVQTSELPTPLESAAQSEVLSNTLSNDVDMLDDSSSVEVKESPFLEETGVKLCDNNNKLNEAPEVEMVDAPDVFKERETVERFIDHNFDCSKQETSNESDPNNAVFPIESPKTLHCVKHESDDNCVSSQSEKGSILNTDVK